MKTVVFFSLLSCLGSFPSLAQTQTQTSNQDSWSSFFTQAKAEAEAAEIEFKKVLDVQKNNGTYDACKAEILDFTITYHQWFIDHFKDFQARDQLLNSAFENASQKITALQGIKMLDLPGQLGGTEVTLGMVIEFLSVLNGRLKNAADDQLQLIISQMEKPRFNPTGATFSQVRDALEIMTKNLNAELKESQTIYALEFTQQPRAYDLVLVISIQEGSTTKKYRLSLTAASTIGLTERERIELIASGDEKIDGYSPDAAKRYFEMYQSIVSPICQDQSFVYFDYLGAPVSKPTPWLAVSSIVSKIPKVVVLSSAELIQKYNIKFDNNPGDITINGRSLGCTMFNDALFYEYKGELIVFTVGSDYKVYIHHASRTGWVHTEIQNAQKTVKISVVNGVPRATYLLKSGETIIVDMNGKTVSK